MGLAGKDRLAFRHAVSELAGWTIARNGRVLRCRLASTEKAEAARFAREAVSLAVESGLAVEVALREARVELVVSGQATVSSPETLEVAARLAALAQWCRLVPELPGRTGRPKLGWRLRGLRDQPPGGTSP